MIILEEQGLRDGFQNLSKIVATEKKLEYINRLVDAGVKRIQVASFVHPRLVPQMADAETVCEGLDHQHDVLYSGLVLNEKGVERGIQAGLKHLACSISASNTHSQKNARKTLEEAKVSFAQMVKMTREAGLVVRGGIQCAFGCRYEGKIEQSHVLDMVRYHLDQGIDELALADSTGMANPMQVKALMREVLKLAKDIPVMLHLHNTENKGLANLFAALELGVKYFDTAFGGLGGCPFIKSASGNIATEDAAHLLHQMDFETGIDIGKVAEMSREMQEFLGYELQGQMYKLWDHKDIAVV